MSLYWPSKTPSSSVDSEVIWAIAPYTIVTSVFTLLNAAGVTIVSQSNDGDVTAAVRLSGGYDGQTAVLNNAIVDSNGDTHNVAIVQPIVDDSTALTSGATSFNPNFTDMIEEAFERCGLEERGGYEMRSARRSANLLFQEWANRGVNLWTVEERSQTLTSGDGTYVLGGDIVDLIEYGITVPDTTQETRYSLTRVSVSTFASRTNTETTGRPTQIYIDRQAGGPVVHLWPIPEQSGYTMVYWVFRRVQDVGAYTNVGDMPFRFVPAFIAGLAFYIAEKKRTDSPDLIMRLKSRYEEEWKRAADEDREKATLTIVPRLSYQGGY